jgi:hypothetical protein
LSKRSISSIYSLSRDFVSKWTKSGDQDLTVDGRGWKKAGLRLYTKTEEQRILRIHRQLDQDPETFFSGASAIQQRYRKLYPNSRVLSLRFIGRTLAKYGLSKTPKVRRKGVSRYLHYPETLIDNLGESLLEVDFIGKKFIQGRTQPVHFIAFSLKKPRKLKHFQRITSETAVEVIRYCRQFFKRYEKPAVVKLDNGFAFAGAGPEPRTLNNVVLFLLKRKIIPVFTAPRKPWNQASVEGANSVFARKFWTRFKFESLSQVDDRLDDFNEAYKNYLDYQKPRQRSRPRDAFIPQVYFIRKVYEHPESQRGYIDVVKEHILLPKAYIGLFVLAEWNLSDEKLTVYFEKDQKPKIVKRPRFILNLKTKQKVVGFYLSPNQ